MENLVFIFTLLLLGMGLSRLEIFPKKWLTSPESFYHLHFFAGLNPAAGASSHLFKRPAGSGASTMGNARNFRDAGAGSFPHIQMAQANYRSAYAHGAAWQHLILRYTNG